MTVASLHEDCLPGDGLTDQVRFAAVQLLRCVVPAMFKAQQPWALIGSLASVLQGLNGYTPPDIDLATSMEGAYTMQGAISPQAVTIRPVQFSSSGPYTSHFGIFESYFVKCEIMGNLVIQLPDGHISVAEHFARWSDKVRILHFDGMHVPVAPLEWQLVANVLLGRLERIEGISRHLLEHGFDRPYVEDLLMDGALGERTIAGTRKALQLD